MRTPAPTTIGRRGFVDDLVRWGAATAPRLVVVGVLVGAAAFGLRGLPVSIVAAIYGLLAGAFLMRKPGLGLPALVVGAAIVPFEVGTGTNTSINFAIIGVAGLAGLWVVRMLTSKAVRLRRSYANRPWLALVVATGLSIVAGDALWNPWVVAKDNFAFVQLAQWAIFVLSACAFWLLANDGGGRNALQRLVWLVLGVGVLLLFGRVGPLAPILSTRILMVGPVFRIWIVVLASSLALFDTALQRWQRVALLAYAVYFLLVMRATSGEYQSGWLPALVGLGAVAAIRMGRGMTRWAAVTAAPLALFFGLVLLPQLALADRWSLETRLLAWQGIFDLMQGRWLFGLGLASYWHYWRDVIGLFSYLDPTTGWLHYTFNPTVNLHNNFLDVFAQSGLIGLGAMIWLMGAIALEARSVFVAEQSGFGRAYAAACGAGLLGMAASGMLVDNIFPFVYNVGLRGFRDSFVGWLLLGGLVLLLATRPFAVDQDENETRPGSSQVWE